jgi:hypothetical protein
MKQERGISLLPGRNTAPLDRREIQRAASMFIGLDTKVNARYEARSSTRFIASVDEDGQELGEIVFSEDIYPGNNIANPNAALSLKGAAAHELAHYYRWQDKTELPHGEMRHVDEAMTSLEAALRYLHDLDKSDIQGLISDSLQRLRLHLAETTSSKA